jgi:hypothetical protein
VTGINPNFVVLDSGNPEIVHLIAAMLEAREAVDRRSWSHPQEPTGFPGRLVGKRLACGRVRRETISADRHWPD